jgi:hypothetical protein
MQVRRRLSYVRCWMEVRRESDIPRSANRAVGGVHNAVRLSSVPVAERTVFNGRTTVRQPLTDASASDRRVHESHAH